MSKYAGFHSADRVEFLLSRSHVRSYADSLVAHFRHFPDSCLIPKRDRFQTRMNGVMVGVKTRSLLLYASGLPVPSKGFFHTTCGCPGCINPKHQHARITLSEVPLFDGVMQYQVEGHKIKVYNPFEDDAATRELVDHMKSRTNAISDAAS